MAASASASFLALRGAADDLSASAAARPGGAWAGSVVTLRKARGNSVAKAAVAASINPTSRYGTAAGKKKQEGTASLPILMPFDPLGVRDAGGAPSTSRGGGGGLYLWGPESAETKKANTTWRRDDRPPVSVERLDRWIRGSVTEIVKRIEEAPFLSFIFANDDDEEASDACRSNSSLTCSSAVRIERDAAAEAEDWPAIQRRWGSNSPDGVILVEELKDQQQHLEKEAKGSTGFASGLGSAATRTWGVLVQGRGGGADCTACYVLNTCRVLSSAGCCTHFCLVRAECSGESAEAQLRKAWLAYGNRYWQ